MNAVFSQNCPWEFKLMGYRPEEWRGEDTVMISRMVGYLTLVQSQAEMGLIPPASVLKSQSDSLFFLDEADGIRRGLVYRDCGVWPRFE